ncbi:MAG: hypothetical protein ACP5O1_09440, partial [Phycisphaerae bacterium]
MLLKPLGHLSKVPGRNARLNVKATTSSNRRQFSKEFGEPIAMLAFPHGDVPGRVCVNRFTPES